jgi:hypothetical protein
MPRKSVNANVSHCSTRNAKNRKRKPKNGKRHYRKKENGNKRRGRNASRSVWRLRHWKPCLKKAKSWPRKHDGRSWRGARAWNHHHD